MKIIIEQIDCLIAKHCEYDDCDCHDRLDDLIELVSSGFNKLNEMIEAIK